VNSLAHPPRLNSAHIAAGSPFNGNADPKYLYIRSVRTSLELDQASQRHPAHDRHEKECQRPPAAHEREPKKRESKDDGQSPGHRKDGLQDVARDLEPTTGPEQLKRTPSKPAPNGDFEWTEPTPEREPPDSSAELHE
jgi:hypothetical protein